jgi:hypothetical protein
VGECHAERLGYDLGRGGGAEELAAASWSAAGATSEGGGVFEAHQAVGEARAERLHRAGVLAALGRQRDAAGHDHARQVGAPGERQHRGGQALVAGGDPENARPPRQRSDLATHHDRGVIAVGQAVHHPRRTLGAAVAGIRARGCERQTRRLANRLGGGAHQQADFPVSGVVAECDGLAVVAAEAPLGAQDQVGRARGLARVPAHARVLGEAEEIAARGAAQHFRFDRETAARALGAGANLARIRVAEDLREGRRPARQAHREKTRKYW